ncbi:MAG: hypothetical protein ACOCWI_03685, partial [Bacillota bacterium]
MANLENKNLYMSLNKRRLIVVLAILGICALCIGLYFITGMDLFLSVMVTLLFLVFPAVIIFLCSKIKILNKLGIVLLCYISGIIVGNVEILPQAFIGGMQATLQ